MATKNIELMESEVPMLIVMNMRERLGYNFWPERTMDIYNIVFASIASFLKRNHSKRNKVTGVAVRDTEGNFIIGGVLSYIEPEEGSEDKGNFNLEFVINENDFKEIEIDNLIEDYERELFTESEHQAWNLANARWADVKCMWDLYRVAIETLVQYISKNLDESPDERIELVSKGIFTAVGVVKDGEKIIAIVPGASIKQMVKDDINL